MSTLQSDSPPPPSSQKMILIADDDNMYRTLAAKFCADLGYMVVVASDAFAALDIIKKNQPDLLLTDFQMPGMSGLELAEKCRELGYRFPVICASANVDIPTIKRFAELDIPIILKPFRLLTLMDVIEEKLVHPKDTAAV